MHLQLLHMLLALQSIYRRINELGVMMFKRLFLCTVLIITPIQARAHERYERPRYEQRHDDTAAILGTILLGILIQQNQERRSMPYYRVPNQPTYCYRELVIDPYGRPFYRTICE